MITVETAKDTVELQLKTAINADVKEEDRYIYNELAFAVYDLVHSDLFGKGPFEITIQADQSSFVITLEKGEACSTR